MINLVIDNPENLSLIQYSVILSILVGLVAICILIARSRDITSGIILSSIFSLLSAVIYLALDAPDVALTEACVGACMSTIFYICVKAKLKSTEYNIIKPKLLNYFILFLFSALWLVALSDIHIFGASDSKALLNSGNLYVENTGTDVGIYSIVAAILASYRGFDTLLETTVIFIAGLSCYLIIGKEFKK